MITRVTAVMFALAIVASSSSSGFLSAASAETSWDANLQQPSRTWQESSRSKGPTFGRCSSRHKHKNASKIPPSPAPSASRAARPPSHQTKPLWKHQASSPRHPRPPDQSCLTLSCSDPYTNSIPGAPCHCVLPIRVCLRFSIALYTFFNLVSELAQEIAAGALLNQSQVRIMGADSDGEEPSKMVVLVNLVPLSDNFDSATALAIFDKFWNKQIIINSNYFGDYDVKYVVYPGLPPSPPPAALSNGREARPLAAEVGYRKEERNGSSRATIFIVLSSVFAFLVCIAVLALYKARSSSVSAARSKLESASAPSLRGKPKAFSISEMEAATGGFSGLRLIGEGGFGRVYAGVLDNGQQVAVKVPKRIDDHQEFAAEVEMLSRLHHRNLVKLIGTCTEDHLRCLVYEFIPNGSLESHLHGADKERAPLDWNARMKIALGAARALAYLHEDAIPRVIHRDFKSSNILLEHDFTPKVSDFGLARAARDEQQSQHIFTRVVGTFGYVAPEYAMTGHLLVKSDVYSYGVVLLELLTGRKPVDMSRPPGQENLVAWVQPFLTDLDALETVVDQLLITDLSSAAGVAAIASLCVQPEAEHRPAMGEVVQALKLIGSSSSSSEGDDQQDDQSCISEQDTRSHPKSLRSSS